MFPRERSEEVTNSQGLSCSTGLGGLYDHLSADGPGIRPVAPRAHQRLEDTGGPFSSGGLIPTSTSNGGGNAGRLPTLGGILSSVPGRVKSLTMNAREEAGDLTLTDEVAVPVRAIRPDDAPALQRLHRRLSKQSIHLRFFGYIRNCPIRWPSIWLTSTVSTALRWLR